MFGKLWHHDFHTNDEEELDEDEINVSILSYCGSEGRFFETIVRGNCKLILRFLPSIRRF